MDVLAEHWKPNQRRIESGQPGAIASDEPRVGPQRRRVCAGVGSRGRTARLDALGLSLESSPHRLDIAPVTLADGERPEPEVVRRRCLGGEHSDGRRAVAESGNPERCSWIAHRATLLSVMGMSAMRASARRAAVIWPFGTRTWSRRERASSKARLGGCVRRVGIDLRHAVEDLRRRGQWCLHALAQGHGVEHGHGPRARRSAAPDKIMAHLVTAGRVAAEDDEAIDQTLGVETVEAQKRVLDQVPVGLPIVGVQPRRPSERAPVRVGRTQGSAAEMMEVALAQSDPRLEIVRVGGSERLQRPDIVRRPDPLRVAVGKLIQELLNSVVLFSRDAVRAQPIAACLASA